MISKILTENAPPAAGPYSQAIRSGDYVYTAGMIPVNPKTGNISQTMEEQTESVLNNLFAVLKEAGVGNKDVVKVNIYLTDMATFSVVNGIYSKYFEEPYPARTCVEVSALPKNVMIMVDAIAFVGH